MTKADFRTAIRSWTGFKDPDVQTDADIDSWIKIAEERCNLELRIADMLQIRTSLVSEARVVVPTDWLANDFIRMVDGPELRYMDRPQFYAEGQPPNTYAVSGRFLLIGGEPDAVNGKTIELHYFGAVPTFVDEDTWLYTKYSSLYMAAVMTPASMRMQEPENAVAYEAQVSNLIGKLNAAYIGTRSAGSRLNRRAKGFG